VLASGPAALIETVVRAIHEVMKRTPAEELDMLSWKSPLACRISWAALEAFPHTSVERDARMADLLIAASNACSDEGDLYLDIALAVAARSFFCRAFESDSLTPQDVLIRIDILLTFVRESWLPDNVDLTRHLSKLRRHIATLFAAPSIWPASPPRRFGRGGAQRTILELVTGSHGQGDELRP